MSYGVHNLTCVQKRQDYKPKCLGCSLPLLVPSKSTESPFVNCECSFSTGAADGVLPSNPPGTAKCRAFVVNLDVIPASRNAAARSESPPRFHPSRNIRTDTKSEAKNRRDAPACAASAVSTLAEIEEAIESLPGFW